MHHQGSGRNGNLPPRLRHLHSRNNHQQHHYRKNGYEDRREGFGVGRFDPSPSSPDLAESASSLRRHLVASLMQHHRAIDRSNRAIQPVSPASQGSSMEIAPYNPAITPSSSVDFPRRIGESSYSLRTSSELLKVLNRIWSLEEQHVSNMSLVKSLKNELDHARTHIRELNRDQQAVQSVRDELEDERRLRKLSESLHRKLAREIHEVKTDFVGSVKEVEKERTMRKRLEDLCDEFAWGIRDYEEELRSLGTKFDKDWTGRADDRLILHVSESWLDERMEMKQDGQEKLASDIETFLQIKRKGQSKINGDVVPKNRVTRRNSIESIDDGHDSSGEESHCFEQRKPSAMELRAQENIATENHINELRKPDIENTKKVAPNQRTKERMAQVKFEERMARAVSANESKNNVEEPKQRQKKPAIAEAIEDGILNKLIKSHYKSESGNMQVEDDHRHDSVWMSQPSPVRPWEVKLPPHDCETESSSRLTTDTIKGKLVEARSKGQRSRSRLKGTKIFPSSNSTLRVPT